ncbi:hypothetical protein I4U23_000208 [Adineta vaga]|nr:hypothetical protein I4U23_000208 [Adineta vaga]
MRIRLLCDKLFVWNIFHSGSSDPLVIRQQISSTRLYIVLLVIFLIILITYSSNQKQTERKTVVIRNRTEYENLQEKYAASLQCFCRKQSIAYNKFTRVSARFHQVCSNNLIGQKWIDFVFDIDRSSILPIDIRTSLSAIWQLIRTFCRSSNNVTEETLFQFYNSLLIDTMLLTEPVLKARVQSTLDLLRHSVASNILQSTIFVYQMTRANQLLSGLLTNYIVILERNKLFVNEHNNLRETNIYTNIYISPNSEIVCSCKTNDSCPLPANIYLPNAVKRLQTYDLNQIKANASLSGLVVDCLPIQATFSSSLECFYNQSCFNILLAAYSTKINISILDPTLPTRFLSSTKIEQLVNELFLEEMRNEINYNDYYQQCSPNLCNYLFFHRFNGISVSIIFMGFIGGIAAILHITTPLIIKMIFYLKKRFFSKRVQDKQYPHVTLSVRLKNSLIQKQSRMTSLNLYTQWSQDHQRYRRGVLATRLYIFLLIIFIWMIILFSDLSNHIENKRYTNLSKEEYENLEKNVSSKLVCPCTKISSSYRDIIDIQVKYHQICSSDFIQSSWYQYFFIPNTSNEKLDFLSIASSYFQTLRTFCHITNLTLTDVIQRFLSRTFLHTQLISNRLFDLQINSTINTFIQSTKSEFRSRMAFTLALIHSNQYLSYTRTSTYLYTKYYYDGGTEMRYIKTVILPTHTIYPNGIKCYCILNSTCDINYVIEQHPEDIHNFNGQLQGIRGGCSVTSTTLKSSLSCWFQKECLGHLKILLSSFGISMPHSPTALDSTLSSVYHMNTSIEQIFDEMMIEQWIVSYSFDKFYHQCQPPFCSFTDGQKTNIIYLCTIIIGLIGGINTVLKLISPILIKVAFMIIDRFKRNRRPNNSSVQQENQLTNGIHTTETSLQTRLMKKIQMFNVFDNGSNDAEIVRGQQLSTRVYLLIFSICICIITMHTQFSTRITTESFANPSNRDYNRLLGLYSQSLQCLCEKIAIEYRGFIEMKTRFHSICFSGFVKDEWRDFLFGTGYENVYDRNDIRDRGSFYFSLLSTLCNISQQIVGHANDQFLSETFFSIQLLPKSKFDTQINDTILQFQRSIVTKFSQIFQLFREILHGNAFVSSYGLNWYWQRGVDENIDRVLTYAITTKNSCSCGTRSDCISSGGLYNNNGSQVFHISGWNIGCSVVETLLHSTMECLYDQTCLRRLLYKLAQSSPQFNKPINISALTLSNSTRFQTNTIIQNIANELFIEQWQTNISYSSYYNQCAPVSCSYEIVPNDSLIHTVYKILGLCGGLRIVLRVFIPLLVNFLLKMWNRFRTNSITPNN